MSKIYNNSDILKEKKKQLEELQKIYQEKKGSAIDQFTNIDDILRATHNIQVDMLYMLKNLAMSSALQNELLYHIYIKGFGGKREDIKIEGLDSLFGNRMVTKNIKLSNITPSTDNEEVYNLDGNGYVVEIIFLSSDSSTDNKEYSVRVTSNDNIIYDDSWDNFNSSSEYQNGATAFDNDRNGYYILNLQNFFFRNGFKINVYNSSATFTEINIKYHKEE